MNFIIDNWYFIVLAIAVLVVSGIAIYTFINYPTDEKLKKVREWLLVIVQQAEKEFGTKTGKMKLAWCYDLFISKFPAIAKVISFESFSLIVDDALNEFEKLLVDNKQLQIKTYDRELTEEEKKVLRNKIS